MANSAALLAAASELDWQSETMAADGDFIFSRELAELSARLRHAAKWLDRRCRPQSSAQASEGSHSGPMVLTRRQAAERLNMSTATLDRFAAAGELKPLKRGRYVRFAIGEIERFQQTQNGSLAAAANVPRRTAQGARPAERAALGA